MVSHAPGKAGQQLARSSLIVAAGLTVTGAGTLGLIALSVRALSSQDAASFTTWWALTTLFGTAFGVFEAYLARLVVAGVAGGRPTAVITGTLAGRASLTAALISVILLAMSPLLSSRLFGGHLGAALLLPVFLSLTATQAVQRGSATGHGRFTAIAVQLATDGIVRVCAAALLVATGTATVVTLMLAACFSAAVSLVVAGRMCPEWLARPRLRNSSVLWRPLLLLLVAAIGPVLANAGPVPWLRATRGVDAATLVAFAGALTLSQIPTQFVAAAFGPLLSQLSHAAARHDLATFRRVQRSGDIAAGALGLLFVAVFAISGRWVLSIYLGPGHELSVAVLAVLASASALMFFAVVQQAGLAAKDSWSTIAIAWILGAVALAAVLLLPLSALTRATMAPAAAVATALTFMMCVRIRRPA